MNTDTKASMWVSKYALTNGKVTLEVGRVSASQPEYFTVGWHGFHKIDRDAHATTEAALAAAEAMRVKKIASLKKKIAQLEKMVFVAEGAP